MVARQLAYNLQVKWPRARSGERGGCRSTSHFSKQDNLFRDRESDIPTSSDIPSGLGQEME